jgi:sigma-B regulation protein RsbU (phosphoserine phosphatase)
MLDELIKVKEGILTLDAQSTLICYTDGVTELLDETDRDFSIDTLTQIVKEHMHLSMHELNNKIIFELNKHKGNRQYIDDIALFSCRIF